MKKLLSTFTTLLALSATLLAGGPGQGETTVRGTGSISKLEVKYNLSQLMGEPTVFISYCWHSDTITTLPTDTVIWLKVQSPDGQTTGFIKHDPSVPKAGEWASDVTGSPNWDKVVVTRWDKNEKSIRYFTADAAKIFWKNGFKVIGAFLSNDQ